MTEEEVLQKMDQFKNAILRLKSENDALKEENVALRSHAQSYSDKVSDKLNEIERLLDEKESAAAEQ